MPCWSPEIANNFIKMAADDGRSFDQLQLQALVYIAHGWCLASAGQPLTGDRPEAWQHGPTYRRIADALAVYGQAPVTREIYKSEVSKHVAFGSDDGPARSELDQVEAALVREIYDNYGEFESWQLSALTRGGAAPWRHVLRDGAGENRDIPHRLIRDQFVEFLRESEERHEGQ